MAETGQADIGLIGLGVMGQNLALNIADHDHRIAVYNRTSSRTEEFAASDEAKGLPVTPCLSLEALIGAVRRPRAIILMIKAGEATDQQIDELSSMLDPGDIVIDGGNARFTDTIRRERGLRERGFQFLGTGISGGEEGARHGPSIMAGGADDAYARVRAIFESIAAKVGDQPCCAHIGPDGAGHFVKMLHNGIEYADMELIAESYAILKDVLGLDYPEMQSIFAEWNRGDLDSFLIEITADILGKNDPDTGRPMPEVILDRAAQKGTGAWAVAAALELGAPAPVLASAVAARSLSMLKEERTRAAEALAGLSVRFEGDKAAFVEALRDALLAAKVCAYAEGFAIMAAAGEEHDWPLDFGEIATIWRGGCIIRARFLQRIKEAYERDRAVANLLIDPYFADLVTRAQPAWREVVATATRHGVAIPALTSALAYFDGYRSARLPANLLQAQRDYFGAHTYERVDRPGSFHTEWTAI